MRGIWNRKKKKGRERRREERRMESEADEGERERERERERLAVSLFYCTIEVMSYPRERELNSIPRIYFGQMRFSFYVGNFL